MLLIVFLQWAICCFFCADFMTLFLNLLYFMENIVDAAKHPCYHVANKYRKTSDNACLAYILWGKGVLFVYTIWDIDRGVFFVYVKKMEKRRMFK